MKRSTHRLDRRSLWLVLTALAVAIPFRSGAEGPGHGQTASFEVRFLKNAIDHHFAALRMTELAAGTDVTRNDEIEPMEGTSPTPGFEDTSAKAASDELKSMARRANRVQREEILMSRNVLRNWYGVEYAAQIDPVNRTRIKLLESSEPGSGFDELFLEIMSRHHFVIMARGTECVVSADLRHEELRRLCRGIVEGQMNEVTSMRELLCREHSVCDYAPLSGLKGTHTGDSEEPGARDKRFRHITRDEDEDGDRHF